MPKPYMIFDALITVFWNRHGNKIGKYVRLCLFVRETYVGQKKILIDSWAYRINEPNASPNLAGTVTTCHIGGFSATTAAAAVTIAKHSDMLPLSNPIVTAILLAFINRLIIYRTILICVMKCGAGGACDMVPNKPLYVFDGRFSTFSFFFLLLLFVLEFGVFNLFLYTWN